MCRSPSRASSPARLAYCISNFPHKQGPQGSTPARPGFHSFIGCWSSHVSHLAPRVDGTAVRVQLTSKPSETPQLINDHSYADMVCSGLGRSQPISRGLEGLERSRAIPPGLERSHPVSSGLTRSRAVSPGLERPRSGMLSRRVCHRTVGTFNLPLALPLLQYHLLQSLHRRPYAVGHQKQPRYPPRVLEVVAAAPPPASARSRRAGARQTRPSAPRARSPAVLSSSQLARRAPRSPWPHIAASRAGPAP